MDSSSILIVVAALIVGLLLGILLTRGLSSPLKQRKQLGEELRQAREKQQLYEREVAEHFVKTSGLVNNLTESYRHLHQHLAASAETLANPNLGDGLLAPKVTQLELDIEQLPALDATMPEPPRDYAPSQGVLNEGYGLDKPASPVKNAAEKDKPQLSVVNSDTAEVESDDPTLKVG
ncbi:MAG: DUF1043 family protein [Porticoccaceae bacterium]|nr:DUF1043 family protein [Porticoccaceae bacterium]